MAFTEDLSEFFCTDDFAVEATIAGVSVNGVYDRELVELDGGAAGWRPVFVCATTDVADVSAGDTMTVDGLTGTFTITQKYVDEDEAVTKLVIEK